MSSDSREVEFGTSVVSPSDSTYRPNRSSVRRWSVSPLRLDDGRVVRGLPPARLGWCVVGPARSRCALPCPAPGLSRFIE